MVTFTSEWDDGSVITTNVIEYDPKTGYVQAELSDEIPSNDASLEKEYITLEDSTELEVCRDCHEYVLKSIMVDDNTGDGIHEEFICRNPEHIL